MYVVYKAKSVKVKKREVLVAIGKPIIKTKNLNYLQKKLDCLTCDTILRHE